MKTEQRIREVIDMMHAGLLANPDKSLGVLLVAVGFMTALEWVVEKDRKEARKIDEAMKDLAKLLRDLAETDSPGPGS